MPFTLIQIVLIAVFVAALGVTLRRSRQGAISRTESFLWSAFWIGAAVVVARPEIASYFAAAVGVGRGADAVVYAAVVALFFLIFRVYVRIDKLERDITTLVRREALDHHRDNHKDSQ